MNTKLLLTALTALTTLSIAASAQEFSRQVEIKEFGGWDRPSGDRNMDTNYSDRVPASCASRLFFSDSNVFLELHFYCEELEGDRTRYQGKRTLTLFTAPSGKRISTVRFGNGSFRLPTLHTFHNVSKGEAYGLMKFREPIAGTYWEKLQYRVDQPVSNDAPYIGVSGVVAFRVTVEDR